MQLYIDKKLHKGYITVKVAEMQQNAIYLQQIIDKYFAKLLKREKICV